MFRFWLGAVIVALGLLPTITLQAQEPDLTQTFDDPAPAPAGGRGICGSVAAMPLVLVGLVWINCRRR